MHVIQLLHFIGNIATDFIELGAAIIGVWCLMYAAYHWRKQ